MTCKAGLTVEEGTPPTGAQLYAAIAALPAPEGVEIIQVDCLSACNAGAAVALSAPGRWSYVYGRMSPDNAADILLVLSDVKLPDGHGVDLLPRFKAAAPDAEVVLLTAYGTIANGGAYQTPFLVASVEDRKGNLLEAFAPVRELALAMPRATSLVLVDAMRSVIDQGTGSAIRQRYGIQADVAGKTGTTQDYTDGWFIMMNPQLVAGARVGFNDNSDTMGSWGQGARSALPIVGDVFQGAFKSRWLDANAQFDIPRRIPPPPQPSPEQQQRQPQNDPLGEIINSIFGKLLKQIQ